MDKKKIKAKIILGLPLTKKEYAYAVLYMNLNQGFYIKKEN